MEPEDGELRFMDSRGNYHHAKPNSPDWHWVAGQPNVEIYESGKWQMGWTE